MSAPICPYCNVIAKLEDSAKVYGGRSYGMIWLCANFPECDAYVGVHKGTSKPLGELANSKLRRARKASHKAFDSFWKGPGGLSRKKAYRALAKALGISVDNCHIGMFGIEDCKRVVEACSQGLKPPRLEQS